MKNNTLIILTTVFLLSLIFFLSSCNKKKDVAQMQLLAGSQALFWPDYSNCDIPVNIAPLNFYILQEHESYQLKASCNNGKDSIVREGRYKVKFPLREWKDLLLKSLYNDITVEIALKGKDSIRHIQFKWYVADSIDPFLTCRMIEPSYQMSSILQTVEYNLETATSRIIFDNRLNQGSCVNCHTPAMNNGNYTVYHVRFKHTGTFISLPDKKIRVNLKSPQFPQGGVYPAWHPDKNIIAFGTSSAYPFVHSKDIVRRTEVYDSFGDIILYNIKENFIQTDLAMAGDGFEETFPCWSPDGEYLYFCQSKDPEREPLEDDTDFSKKIRYSLVRMKYNKLSGKFSAKDTIINADSSGKTVSFPRISPNGRLLVACISDHGTFPIRHPESDLYLIDLGDTLTHEFRNRDRNIKTGTRFTVQFLEKANSHLTESYHSWSSNSQWLVYSSKCMDGLYARPFLCHIDSNGNAHKPLLLPQNDPAVYLELLQSFNVPELYRQAINVDAEEAFEMSKLPIIKPDSICIYHFEKSIPLEYFPKRTGSQQPI